MRILRAGLLQRVTFFRLSAGIGLCLVVCQGTLSQTPVINEFMASNQVAVLELDDAYDGDDWMELYNPGDLIQMAGYHLSDDPTNLTKFTFPDTLANLTYLTQNDYMLIWLDNDFDQTGLHANFKLSSDGEGIWLTAPDGVTVLDSIVFSAQQTDISFGRSCDGCPTWEPFNVATPNASNAQTDLPSQSLYINEVLLNNVGNLVDEMFEAEPWLEIFNPNSEQVNLAGYSLVTSLGESYTIPNIDAVATTVPGNGFLLLWLDGQPGQGAHHLGLEVSLETQTLSLIGPDLAIVDEFEAEELTFTDISQGRASDGAPDLVWFDFPTPRVTNTLIMVPPDPVAINECQSFNSGNILQGVNFADDWIEIHNLSDEPINLAGYYLSDRLNNPVKWRFPTDAGDSTVVAPHDYVVIWADEEQNQGWNHTNFKLNNLGEVVVLRSPDGFTIADSVHFGSSEPGESYSRLPDGSGPFAWVQDPTPGACNDCSTSTWSLESANFPLYVGRNPARRGDSFWLSEEAVLFNVGGQYIGTFSHGQHEFAFDLKGVFLFKGLSGEACRVVLTRE